MSSDGTEHAAACWLALAAEARASAEQTTDPEARQVLFDIADRYERLAKRAQVIGKGQDAKN